MVHNSERLTALLVISVALLGCAASSTSPGAAGASTADASDASIPLADSATGPAEDTSPPLVDAAEAGPVEDAAAVPDAGTPTTDTTQGADVPPSPSPHGAPCAEGDQCEGLLCITDDLFPGFDGGYCSALCNPHLFGTCGPSAECVPVESYGSVCAATCETAADCRPDGYACIGVCVPDLFTSALPSPGIVTGDEPPIDSALSAIDDERLMRRVRVLSGAEPWDGPTGPATIHSRAVSHPDHAIALDYIEAELTAMGLEVTRLPFESGTKTLVNIEARIAGTQEAPPILVTAHYDSTGTSDPGYDASADPAPGANDDATGVATALEVASVLTAGEAPRRPVRIVLFDGEELGLLGSARYAGDLAKASAPLGCVLNVDMVGEAQPSTPGRFFYVFSQASVPHAALGAEAIAAFVPQASPVTSGYTDAGGQDSVSFWTRGYCSVAMSTFPRPLTNHTSADEVDQLQPGFLLGVTRAAVATALAWIHLDPAPP